MIDPFHLYSSLRTETMDLKILFTNLTSPVYPNSHLNLSTLPPNKLTEVCREPCSGNTSRIHCRSLSYQNIDLRSPKRDTASLCGFLCNPQNPKQYLPGM